MFGDDEEDLLSTAWTSSDAAPSALPALAPAQSDAVAPPAQTAPTPDPEPQPLIMQSAPVPDAAARRGAGAGILLSGGAATVGWIAGGAWGAGAGFLLLGAARNAWRAKTLWPSAVTGDREEAGKSATMAVVGALLGGYLGYRAVMARKEHKGHDD